MYLECVSVCIRTPIVGPGAKEVERPQRGMRIIRENSYSSRTNILGIYRDDPISVCSVVGKPLHRNLSNTTAPPELVPPNHVLGR